MDCPLPGSSTPTPARRWARSRRSLTAQPARSKVRIHGGGCAGVTTKYQRTREKRHRRVPTKQKAAVKFSHRQRLRLEGALRQKQWNRLRRRRLQRDPLRSRRKPPHRHLLQHQPRQKPRKRRRCRRLQFQIPVLQRLASARTGYAITSQHSCWPDSIEMSALKPSFLPTALNTTTKAPWIVVFNAVGKKLGF